MMAEGWDPRRWRDEDPATPRLLEDLLLACREERGQPGGPGAHAGCCGTGCRGYPSSSPRSTSPCRPPCSAPSTCFCCLPCPRGSPAPQPPASCWHAASSPAASPRCCRPPWGAGEETGRGGRSPRPQGDAGSGHVSAQQRLGETWDACLGMCRGTFGTGASSLLPLPSLTPPAPSVWGGPQSPSSLPNVPLPSPSPGCRWFKSHRSSTWSPPWC